MIETKVHPTAIVDPSAKIGASAEIVKKGSLFAALHAGNGTMFFVGFNKGL